MTRLLVATTNKGKFAEVKAFLRDLPLDVVGLADLGSFPEVIEDGHTFEENALKKARSYANFSGLLTVADDSGLEVDALGGAPGIFSARYAGEECDDDKNNAKVLRELADTPDDARTGRFVCVLALCAPGEDGFTEWTVRESCEGRIAHSLRGSNGFGYDPLFFYPPFNKTFGEIDRETKATVSHRGKALAQLAEILPALVDLAAKP